MTERNHVRRWCAILCKRVNGGVRGLKRGCCCCKPSIYQDTGEQESIGMLMTVPSSSLSPNMELSYAVPLAPLLQPGVTYAFPSGLLSALGGEGQWFPNVEESNYFHPPNWNHPTSVNESQGILLSEIKISKLLLNHGEYFSPIYFALQMFS